MSLREIFYKSFTNQGINLAVIQFALSSSQQVIRRTSLINRLRTRILYYADNNSYR